jgi:hypothetical protein
LKRERKLNADSCWNKTALLRAVLGFVMIAGTSSHAEETSRTFRIAAQPLANALVLFSEQSGLAVMAPADLVCDKTAPAVEGNMPPLTALDRLLKGSGLKYARSADGALTIAPAGSTKAIERKPPAPQVEVVPNLRITESFSGRGSTTRQIRQNTLTKHFSDAVSPGSAASFGSPSGRRRLPGFAVGITRNGAQGILVGAGLAGRPSGNSGIPHGADRCDAASLLAAHSIDMAHTNDGRIILQPRHG